MYSTLTISMPLRNTTDNVHTTIQSLSSPMRMSQLKNVAEILKQHFKISVPPYC